MPNLVILLVDDLGYGDLGCYGNDTMKTPNIDRMAREGIKLTQTIVSEPICTPSRASLMTGRYAARSGMTSHDNKFRVLNSAAHPGGLSRKEITIAEVLKKVNYSTTAIGKWHLGIGDGGKYLPTEHGFDYYYGMPITNVQTCGEKNRKVFPDQHEVIFFLRTLIWKNKGVFFTTLLLVILMNYFLRFLKLWKLIFIIFFCIFVAYFFAINFTLLSKKSCILYENKKLIEQPVKLQNLTRKFTNKAKDFINKNKDNNFFLFMSYVKVHTALFTMKEFEGVSMNGEYGDNVEEMDWSVGEIMKTLRQNNLLEDTIVFFTSDNGPFLERNNEGGFPGFIVKNGERKYLKGGKGQNWEGGVRVPTVIQWKGKIEENRTINELVTLMDIFPTMLELTNQTVPSGVKIDGKSLVPIITKNEKSSHDLFVHLCGNKVTALRYQGRYKMHMKTSQWEEGRNNCPYKVICGCDGEDATEEKPYLLYDLEEDPSESSPIPPHSQLYLNISSQINQSLSLLSPSLVFPPSRLHSIFNPLLMPCCNFPYCQCDEAEN